jgi:hypothetical protein
MKAKNVSGSPGALDSAGETSEAAPLRYAIVTPSYYVDFERCKLLVETTERHVASHVQHYLVVDRSDQKLFAPLASSRTHVLLKEDVLEGALWQVPFARRWWLDVHGAVPSPRLPVRGWIVQQLAKLFIHRVLSEDVYLFVDSGAFFVRPYDPSGIARGGEVPLFREEGAFFLSKETRRWYEICAALLGVRPASAYPVNYVKTNVTWRRDNLIRLHEHIAQVTGRSSFDALSRQIMLSEYYLYGMYCDLILGDRSRHYHSDLIETLSHWPAHPLGVRELRELRAKLEPQQVLVMINEKSRTPLSAIRQSFEG